MFEYLAACSIAQCAVVNLATYMAAAPEASHQFGSIFFGQRGEPRAAEANPIRSVMETQLWWEGHRGQERRHRQPALDARVPWLPAVSAGGGGRDNEFHRLQRKGVTFHALRPAAPALSGPPSPTLSTASCLPPSMLLHAI
ncbi:hypothetical protein HaLaN_33030 [Haematococcus lacustris]|uniref:Uncharacterized protein n=1 Tax=Haematococcus lacustris TaxID=44745 RepID=A0A6A0ALE8_HAELA|nr:hypothetical protein HaLaN_33030 [Haematococcus lacustris]